MTVEESTAFNGKRLVVNIPNDMCLRLQNYFSSLDRTFDLPVHHDALSYNDSVDMCPASDHEGRAVKFAVNLAIDLH